MKGHLCRAFADLTCHVEDLHALAVEGQYRDISPDMHRVLVSQLRLGLAAMDDKLTAVAAIIERPAR